MQNCFAMNNELQCCIPICVPSADSNCNRHWRIKGKFWPFVTVCSCFFYILLTLQVHTHPSIMSIPAGQMCQESDSIWDRKNRSARNIWVCAHARIHVHCTLARICHFNDYEIKNTEWRCTLWLITGGFGVILSNSLTFWETSSRVRWEDWWHFHIFMVNWSQHSIKMETGDNIWSDWLYHGQKQLISPHEKQHGSEN